MENGTLVSLEGIDKTGKTLQWEILRTHYPEFHYISDSPEIAPWDHVFHNGPDFEEPISEVGKCFTFLAARLDAYARDVEESLEDGGTVIADRYADSWIAYQSVKLAEESGSVEQYREVLREIHDLAVEAGLLTDPDLTILITLDEDELERRLEYTEDPTEYEEVETLMDAQAVYKEIATERDRIKCIHDSGQGVCEIFEEFHGILQDEGVT